MRENADQKNSDDGHFSRSARSIFNWNDRNKKNDTNKKKNMNKKIDCTLEITWTNFVTVKTLLFPKIIYHAASQKFNTTDLFILLVN